jgi:hypothetical protein
MIQKIKRVGNLISNMGIRYLFFRVMHTVKTKLGWHKKTFPVQPKFEDHITLIEWKKNLPKFFFYGKEIHDLPKNKSENLKQIVEDIKLGKYRFFNKSIFDLGTSYNWIQNPATSYEYNISKHWSEIQDLSKEAGDIKYVWEKARFSFLYDVIRYDYHYEDDQSGFVFKEIENFIDQNPINQGPNYKCSQEISLRTLNWTFALYYYKDSNHLTEKLFKKIMNAIYWQLHHVFHNINFSRIAVRNNHAITETLMLYLSDKLFPFMPNVKTWSKKGKQWFEKEIKYQIYKDGTFLQFSMNYHRVVVQLLTWGIRLSEIHEDPFSQIVYQRAEKSLEFLDACSDPVTGKLPNYGSNDGALFFKLTDTDYRDYRSQLDDLRAVLFRKVYFDFKSTSWYGLTPEKVAYKHPNDVSIFEEGGYYMIQENNTKTFLRCGKYKDRPFQSDNLHLDIWVNGINILQDSGSYKYNTDKVTIDYFNGSEGHNTVSVDNENQMLKGGRFIWYYWIKEARASIKSKKDFYEFSGKIKAFKQIHKNIHHTRDVLKYKGENRWQIKDLLSNKNTKTIYQYWHIPISYINHVEITSKDRQGNSLQPLVEEKWYSGYYGFKEKSIRITFATQSDTFNTIISINNL